MIKVAHSLMAESNQKIKPLPIVFWGLEIKLGRFMCSHFLGLQNRLDHIKLFWRLSPCRKI